MSVGAFQCMFRCPKNAFCCGPHRCYPRAHSDVFAHKYYSHIEQRSLLTGALALSKLFALARHRTHLQQTPGMFRRVVVCFITHQIQIVDRIFSFALGVAQPCGFVVIVNIYIAIQ